MTGETRSRSLSLVLRRTFALMRLSTALLALAASPDRLVAWAGRNEATWVSISSRSTVTSSWPEARSLWKRIRRNASRMVSSRV